jgi:hypothetical protein
MARHQFTVSLELPPGVSHNEMRQYIHDAVSEWKYQLKPITACDPEDPDDDYDYLTALDESTIRVT